MQQLIRQRGYNLDEFEGFMNREMNALGSGHRLAGTPNNSFSAAASTNPKQVFSQMETASVPNERLMRPILPFPELKVDPDDENGSEVFSWREDGKVVDYLEQKGEESDNDDEFIEPAAVGRIKNEKNQKESDLCKETRTFKKTQVKSNDKNIDNDVKEPCAFKNETINLNEAVEELNYNHESPIKSECIEHEELHIKDEEDDDIILKSETTYDSQCPFIQQEVRITNKEEGKKKQNKKSQKHGNQSMSHQCPECSYSTIYKSYLKRHSIKHKRPEEVHWYYCQECPYRASLKSNLKVHIEIHNSNKLILKCSECSYETWKLTNLKRHEIRHQGENGKEWHRCLKCSYKTSYKQNLLSHVLSHESKEELNISSQEPGNHFISHQCLECSYSSFNKSRLRMHLIKHKKPEEIVWYNCHRCPYKTYLKGNLKIHVEIHNRIKLILKCSSCSYKTWRQPDLKRHQIRRHRGDDGKGWHRCLECAYKSQYKQNLQNHLISHKSGDEIQWLACSQCSFKTAHKSSLRHHQLKHKAAHEVEWFYCYKCSHKTNRKSSLLKHISTHKKKLQNSGK